MSLSETLKSGVITGRARLPFLAQYSALQERRASQEHELGEIRRLRTAGISRSEAAGLGHAEPSGTSFYRLDGTSVFGTVLMSVTSFGPDDLEVAYKVPMEADMDEGILQGTLLLKLNQNEQKTVGFIQDGLGMLLAVPEGFDISMQDVDELILEVETEGRITTDTFTNWHTNAFEPAARPVRLGMTA